MTGEQLELGKLPSKADVTNQEEKALTMLGALNDQDTARWMTRKEMAAFGLTERDCRKARQESKGRIIFGPKGYKATSDATIEEIQRAAATLASQAKAMLAEASELWRVYHAGTGAGPGTGTEGGKP